MTSPAIRRPPVALTIAGSDSGGGAGIQADLKTFTVLGVYGMSAVTAITAQNTVKVREALVLEPALVAAQIDAVMDDIGCDAAKTGMLANAEIVAAVADRVKAHGIDNLVVDPVMIAKSGDALLAEEARDALITLLIPLAYVVTPNLYEAGVLVGAEVNTVADMSAAARKIADMGAACVVVKGGHLANDPMDLFYVAQGELEVRMEGPRFFTPNTHGTGCTFSAAIAAGLATGPEVADAVALAKRFISLAIENALDLGSGHGPTNHIRAGLLLSSEGRRGQTGANG